MHTGNKVIRKSVKEGIYSEKCTYECNLTPLDAQIEEEKGIWSDFATEGLLIDKSKPGVIQKVTV